MQLPEKYSPHGLFLKIPEDSPFHNEVTANLCPNQTQSADLNKVPVFLLTKIPLILAEWERLNPSNPEWSIPNSTHICTTASKTRSSRELKPKDSLNFVLIRITFLSSQQKTSRAVGIVIQDIRAIKRKVQPLRCFLSCWRYNHAFSVVSHKTP